MKATVNSTTVVQDAVCAGLCKSYRNSVDSKVLANNTQSTPWENKRLRTF